MDHHRRTDRRHRILPDLHLPTLPTIVASWSLLQISLNCMIAPCVAILSDRVPQKYRGSMSAFYGAGQIVGQSMGTIIGSASSMLRRPAS